MFLSCHSIPQVRCARYHVPGVHMHQNHECFVIDDAQGILSPQHRLGGCYIEENHKLVKNRILPLEAYYNLCTHVNLLVTFVPRCAEYYEKWHAFA